MFNPLYTVFSDVEGLQRNPLFAGLFWAAFSCIVLACNAAGQLQVGTVGLIGIIVLFLMLGAVGCYWYIVSIHFLGEWFGRAQRSTSSPRATERQWSIALQGVWPLILLGPSVSAQRWCPSLGSLMTFGILAGSGFTLIAAVRRAYNIPWSQASLCLFLTVVLGSLAVGGLIGWPVMFILGTKNFSIAIPL